MPDVPSKLMMLPEFECHLRFQQFDSAHSDETVPNDVVSTAVRITHDGKLRLWNIARIGTCSVSYAIAVLILSAALDSHRFAAPRRGWVERAVTSSLERNHVPRTSAFSFFTSDVAINMMMKVPAIAAHVMIKNTKELTIALSRPSVRITAGYLLRGPHSRPLLGSFG